MKNSPKLLWVSALAVIFFIAHVVLLPSTLEDIDSLNFALGLHDFDPTKHQPHPPGYPVFIALGKLTRAVVPNDAAALAFVGVLFGALAVFPMMVLFDALGELDARRDTRASAVTAAMATVLAVASPLYWFNALRPLSDIPGLAMTLAAQAALVRAFVFQRLNPERTPEALARSGQMIVLGAFLSALAIGLRSQAMWLTLPLLAVVILQRVGRGAAGALLGSAMTFSIGALLWFVPLVAASGGLRTYIAALTVQGGEDFSGVDMLYRNPTPRRLAFSLLETFIYPWASAPLGWIVFALAAVGAILLLRRSPRALIVVLFLTGPYAIFHLLFQETVTTRYALPLIPPIAFLVVHGLRTMLAAAPARLHALSTVIVAALAAWSLALTLPAARVYAREGSPAFAAIRDLRESLRSEPGAVIAMHQGLARPIQTQDFGSTRVLKSPPMREWLELAEYWRSGGTGPVWFLADPARTDIELIDPLSKALRAHYIWSFAREKFMSGVRPDIVDLIRIESPPGWFAEEGWHLTSETLNMSERLGRSAAVAYVRSRPDAALLVIGGESTGGPAVVSLSIDERPVDRWEVRGGGRFVKRIQLPPGALAAPSAFRRVVASYALPDGKPAGIRLTEFTVEPTEALFYVQDAGWNEIEYSKELQRRWRWTTAKASTFINSGGRDVMLTISGESPLKYFDSSPNIVVRAGNTVVASASPAADFTIEAKIPAADLRAADGTVTIETDQTFVPADRSRSPDKRTLGLRIFTFDVRPD